MATGSGTGLPTSSAALTTLTAALAQYNENILWEGDITKARLLLEAIRWIIVNRPNSASLGGQVSYETLTGMEKQISQFVKGRTTQRSTFTRGKAIL